MASLHVLAFDQESRPIQFDTWLDDLQLYLLSDSRDGISLFDHTSDAAPAPPTTAHSVTRSQTAQALYNAVVARYSSPGPAALGRLLLPYLFPELSAFATVEDLVTHPRTSDARYRAALPVEDHFLSLDPTVLTIDLLEQHLLVAETSVVTIGAARGTPRTPFLEGCSPSPLAPSYASPATIDVPGAEGGRIGGGGSGGGGGGDSGGGGGSGGGGSGGSGGGSGGFGGGGGGSGGSGGSGRGGSGSGRTGAQCGGFGGGQRQQLQCRSETPSPQQLRESGVAIFDLDYDAILAALHALSVGVEGDCYLCVPPNPGASRCFYRDSTTLTPLSAPIPVRPVDPSKGPVLARSSTMLLCPAVPSGSLSGLHLPSFSTNLVSASGHAAPPCSCRLLSHQTLLWHHRLGHPSLPRLCGMHSRLLVSGLPRSLPPLPPSPAPPCLPCVEGRQRATPHSSSFPPTTAPLQTLHMDVWGLARRRIGLVMEVPRTSMIHAAAPHFLWLFAVRYAAHQLNLWPRVSLPETSPTLR
ncbi:unnamed protein product [Closterium sp. NIES-53]